MRFLRFFLAWVGMALFGIWFTLRLWSVQGKPWLLPRVLVPLEWLLVVAGFGLLAYHLYRAWRRRNAPSELTDGVLVPLVRFWRNWRDTRVPEDTVRLEGLDWTIRVGFRDGPIPAPRPPAFTFDPVPRCPGCGLPVVERPQGALKLRSCASDACSWRELSREPLARTAARLSRAARKAWFLSTPG